MKQTIKQLSQIEHVLKRPSMYIGSIVLEPKEEFVLNEEGDKFIIKQRSYNPGLIKIFNELIDNTIDEYIRTNGKYSNKISVKITESTFEVQDNGRGIPNETMQNLKGETKYQAEVAFTEMLSGANYENGDEATIGTNGLGSKASSIFSLKSTIINDDGEKCITITTKDHLGDVSVKETPSKNQGIHFKIWPDLEYFGMSEIDEVHQNVIKERLLHLSIAYPEITFKFNGKSLKLNKKNYFGMFDIKNTIQLNDKVTIGVGHSPSEQFEQFSLVNGLITKDGRHTQDLTNEIVNPIREKLSKKFKTIKPADIKNKLRVVIIFREFPNARYDSQTKEVLKNSSREIKDYLGDYDLTPFVRKIQKDDDIMLHITELFLLKEQAKQNAELKKLAKKPKKIKSDKFMPPIGEWKNIWLAEGDSAALNAAQWFDRKGNGFFAMFGVPPNAYSMKPSEILKSKKLIELQKIIGLDFSKRTQDKLNFENIIIISDYDLPGHFIAGQLLGLFFRYGKNLFEEGRVKRFTTPLIVAFDNKENIVNWFYTFEEYQDFQRNNDVSKLKFDFKKGLGSWDNEEMEFILQEDGIDKMLEVYTLEDVENESKIFEAWLGSDSQIRKDMLEGFEFNIMNM